MDTIGLEMLMPVLQPAELWQTTDRYDIDVLFKARGLVGQAVRARDHPRGMRHAARRPRDPLLPRAAADLVPPADEGARRAAPAGRDPAHAGVHHEGLLQLRPRPRGARGVLREAPRRLRPDLRPVRARDLRGGGRRRHDGRSRRRGVRRAEPQRRGRPRAVLELRLRRQPRGCALAPAGAPSSRPRSTPPRRSRRRARRPSRAWPRCSASTRRRRRRRCRSSSTARWCSRSCAATTGCTR